MEIKLDVTRHCVETALRSRHEAAVAAMLKKGADLDRWAPVVELTRQCLEQFDFGRLRTRYPVLAGSTEADVSVRLVAGNPRITINGKPVDCPRK